MRKRAMGLVLGLMCIHGCAAPDAAFVGEYVGTYACSGQARETGSLYAEGPAMQVLVIALDPDDGGAFIDGQGCPLRLDVRSESEARPFVNRACPATLPDGRPIVATVRSGTVRLIGDRLSYTMAIELELPTYIIDATCTYEGERAP